MYFKLCIVIWLNHKRNNLKNSTYVLYLSFVPNDFFFNFFFIFVIVDLR